MSDFMGAGVTGDGTQPPAHPSGPPEDAPSSGSPAVGPYPPLPPGAAPYPPPPDATVGYPTPTYPTPYMAPYGPPPTTTRAPWIVGIAAAVVVVIAVVVTMALVNRTDPGSNAVAAGPASASTTAVAAGADEADIRGVTEAYLDAATQGDITALKDLMCDQYRSLVGDTPGNGVGGATDGTAGGSFGQLPGDITFEVTTIEVSGTTATATVTMRFSGSDGASGSTKLPLRLIKENGSWKVCA